MDSYYPAGPKSAPKNLTEPTPQYHRHAWIAMLALVLFAALYFLMTGWLIHQAWFMTAAIITGGKESWMGLVVAVPCALLALFMLKALFFVKHGDQSRDLEITAADQPRLFAFLHRLADEAKAPRPHRVFITSNVNAAVFYDLSLLNLVFPSRKNLVIGLGLVNVLTLSELKAVLAHEFGHFAQRSMAVGRWVYVAQQIADHLISRRDKFDQFLRQLSSIDLRVAWVGWILRLIVWSIRSLLESLFRLVMLAQRALSREMELQADLVSVSLAGSDALVHALYRTQAADDAWDRALSFANEEFHQGRLVTDIYALQTRIIAHLSRIRADKYHGQPPTLPPIKAAEHRIFKSDIAQSPRMWRTHPHNHEREENAKRHYLAAPLDNRLAWDIFDRAEALRQQVTQSLAPQGKAEPSSSAESLRLLDERFNRESYNRRYLGLYLSDFITHYAQTLTDLYRTSATGSKSELAQLYPPSLETDLQQQRALNKELHLLERLHDGVLTAPGGIIRHRNRQLSKSQLPQAIASLRAEVRSLEEHINDHHQRCRSSHLAAAKKIGGGWDAQILDLLAHLHYAEHSNADLRDAQRAFHNIYAIVTADGRVSHKERARLLKAAQNLYEPLAYIFTQGAHLVLNQAVAERLKIKNWNELLCEFKLPPPDDTQLQSWLEVVDGWVDEASYALSQLRQASLDELLITESRIAQACIDGTTLGTSPTLGKIPKGYPTLVPGSERALQKKLGWWDKFQIADGFFPATARLVVAGTIVAGIVGFGNHFGDAKITIFNGLSIPVTVHASGFEKRLDPDSHTSFRVPLGTQLIQTQTLKGASVESFDAPVDRAFAHYVYNIESAASLVEWTAVYGNVTQPPPQRLGAPRWFKTSADFVFEQAPESISTSKRSKGGSRLVLSRDPNLLPFEALSETEDEADRIRMIDAHIRWDTSDSPLLLEWMGMAQSSPNAHTQIQARLVENPNDVFARRVEQDIAGDQRTNVCAEHIKQAKINPDDDWIYLALRCENDQAKRNRLFLAMYQKKPQNAWLAYAAAYVLVGERQWSEALSAMNKAAAAEPSMATTLAVEMARVKRAISGEHALLSDLESKSFFLKQWLEMGQLSSYRLLHQGQHQIALEQARTDFGAVPPGLLRLLAASDGAPQTLIEQALALSDDKGLDQTTIGASLGLALRERRPIDTMLTRVEAALGRDKDGFIRFAQALQKGSNVDTAERELIGVSAFTRGQAYVLALIYKPGATNKQWRRDVKALLFPNERPYFSY
jgi:Zn-dependent protease with chaperone function